jgi:biopolymer transport protein ExbD
MKSKLMALFALLFVTATGLNAQNRQRFSPEESAKNHAEALAKSLELNDEQKQKVYNITLKFAYDRQESMSSSQDLTREQRMEQFQQMQKQQADSIKTVLTEEQQVKYDEFAKTAANRFQNRQGQRPERRGNGEFGGRNRQE